VLYRAAVLLVLGMALASLNHETFRRTGVLQHIAAAYLVAFVVLCLPRRWQLPVIADDGDARRFQLLACDTDIVDLEQQDRAPADSGIGHLNSCSIRTLEFSRGGFLEDHRQAKALSEERHSVPVPGSVDADPDDATHIHAAHGKCATE